MGVFGEMGEAVEWRSEDVDGLAEGALEEGMVPAVGGIVV